MSISFSERRQAIAGLVIFIAFVFIPQAYAFSPFRSWQQQQVPLEDQGHTYQSFDWSAVEPSRRLQYTPCYGSLQCARLEVPLNWNDSDNGRRIAIAVAKLPAKVPVTDARYGGVVVLNPGGPGESGIHQVLSGGLYIRDILDAPEPLSEEGKFFDILSFDPRGVKYTTPHLHCFPDAFNQQTWQLSLMDYSLLWESDTSIALEWARTEALSQSCANGADIIRYVNTPQVVEDMLAIIERHGEWREVEAERLLSQGSLPPALHQEIRTRTSYNPNTEQLQYWGVSYGTILGQTFAAMHPDRVSRLTIDGVVDPDDYYSGTWLKNLNDSDGIMKKFAEYCFQAGPKNCSLYTGSSAQQIEERVERIVFNLRENPIAVPATLDTGPDIVTFGDILLYSIGAMAFPYSSAERFYDLLADIEDGNATQIGLGNQKRLKLQPAAVSKSCRREGPFSDTCVSDYYFALFGTTQAIQCMDSRSLATSDKDEPWMSKSAFRAYFAKLREQSKWFSATWARQRLSCVGHTAQPAWRPLQARDDGRILTGQNTSHPLLIITNTHDTVTPRANALRAASLFPGSAVLQHDAEGHCSHANPSVCTAAHVRSYFQTGTLPGSESTRASAAAGQGVVAAVCEPEKRPFVGCVRRDENGECIGRDPDQEALWKALEGLTQVWP